jgi:hypothetical protein
MVARINQTSVLSTTTYMAKLRGGAINDDMASADNPTILAQLPCVFYGGENCNVIGTLHNIHGNTRRGAIDDDMNSLGAQTF